MRKPLSNELRNLFYGDALICSACGCFIFMAPVSPPGRVHFSDITRRYWHHVKECMPLKKYLVRLRSGKISEAIDNQNDYAYDTKVEPHFISLIPGIELT